MRLARQPAAACRPRDPIGCGREAVAAWLLVLPALAGLVVFVLAPCAVVLAMAMTDWQLGSTTFNVVGLDNFHRLLTDPAVRISAENTVVYGLAVTAGSMMLGLGLALLIEASTVGRAFFRSIFFLPAVSTTVAMAIVWEFLLHPTLGPINLLLGELGVPTVYFLSDPKLVLPTLAAIGIWENAGFNMVLFLAGLKMIPSELYQAAAIDGADRPWERFWTVTFPMLGPTLLFATVITLLRCFKVFDIVAAITQGGPQRASEVLLFTIYQEGFNFFHMGYAAALTVAFVAVLVAIMAIQMRLLGRRVHYR